MSNPFTGERRQIRQQAQRMQSEAADNGRAALDNRGAVKAGTFNAAGTFSTYGILGVTPLGTGFTIRGV